MIRTVGYYFERPDSSNPFVLSGARSLLYDWHGLVTAKVQPATTPAVATPETGLNPSHPVHTGTHFRYAGWSDDGTIDQAELDAAAQFDRRRAAGAEPGTKPDTFSSAWTGRPRLS